MEENNKAISRNGHELKDMYDPETNTLDIRSNGLYPSNVLSNLCSNGFRLDGMVCSSMEGFLQSLKRQDINKQRQICSMKGGNARKMSVTSWQTDQIVWWKGKAIDRQSQAYQDLIHRAYKAMFEQKELFGVTDGKAVGTLVEHAFQEHLKKQYDLCVGNSASGLDLPSVNTDIKVTSYKQPQSSCPFKDSKQKIYGLGYNLIVFVYQKHDDSKKRKGML